MSVFPAESLYPGVLLFPWDPNPPFIEGGSLKVRIRIAFGASIAADPATWTWTDVTAWWHTPDDVTIGWGRSSGAEQAETSTLSLTLKNTDGRFTAYDPRSPYWPNVRKWTPIQFDVDLGDGAGWRNRFSGYVRKWPLTWPGNSPFMALAKVEAVGVLGRLGRGKPPVRSALRRTITASGPAAYWPAEDGVLAESAGSAMSGQGAMRVQGTVEFKPVADYAPFGPVTTRFGTSALADLAAGGSLHAALPSAATAATAAAETWTLYVAAQADITTTSADVVLLEWTTDGGTYTRWQLILTTTSRTRVIGYTAAGAATTIIDHPSASVGFGVHAVAAIRAAGVVTVRIYGFGLSTPVASGTLGGTLGGVTSVAANPTGTTATSEMPVGHIAVWPTSAPPIPIASFIDSYGNIVRDALRSHYMEDAVDRLARLTAEDGINLTTPASSPWVEATPMGWQAPGTPIALYQESEDADGGLLYESGFGLGYLPRDARYNPPVALTIDNAAGQLGAPFEPVDDDQMLRNVWTVERVDGSSAVAVDAESVEHQGEIEGSARLNLATDGPLPSQAGWRLHQSTVKETRYPAVSLNVAANRSLAAAWCDCRPGSRVQVLNPPAQNVPGTVDQLIVGATEVFRGRRHWRVTLNVVPASPWMVATADGDQRVAADGSTLALAVDEDDLTLMLASTAENRPWTQDAADMPVDVRLGGERVTVTAIAYGVNDGFDRTNVDGWGPGYDLFNAPATAFQVPGTGVGTISPPALTTDVIAARLVGGADQDVRVRVIGPGTPTGGSITQGLVARMVDASNFYRAVLTVTTGGVVSAQLWKRVSGLTSLGSTSTSLSAGSSIWVRVQCDGDQIRMKAWQNGTTEPSGWTLTATDTSLDGGYAGVLARRESGNTSPTTLQFDNFIIYSPQRLTVSARAVNGVTRAWPAGTEVDVWRPAIVAL